MRYVKVIGETYQDALKKLRETYGSEARIYKQGTYPAEGFFNKLARKERYLIEAAIVEKSSSDSRKSQIDRLKMVARKEPTSTSQPSSNLVSTMAKPPVKEDKKEPPSTSGEIQDFISGLEKKGIPVATRAQDSLPPQTEELTRDIQLIKENLMRLQVGGGVAADSREFEGLEKELKSQYLSDAWITEFISDLKSRLPQKEWKYSKRVLAVAREVFASRVKTATVNHSRKVLALVGPTGVGKTTSLAKLAGRYRLHEQLTTALLTVDTFRVGATEQLKVYAEILDAPFYICKSPEMLQQKVEELAPQYDVLLLDTMGMSPHNKNFMERLQGYLDPISSVTETVLVMSAQLRKEDSFAVMDKYDVLAPKKMILTKLDETFVYGQFVELAERFDKSFLYFCTGQQVPEDIVPADKKWMAEKVFENYEKKLYPNGE